MTETSWRAGTTRCLLMAFARTRAATSTSRRTIVEAARHLVKHRSIIPSRSTRCRRERLMPVPRFTASIIAVALLAAPLVTRAQSYPSKPIRLVTSAAGGSIDFVARLLAPGLSDVMGQPVVVDNRGGAGGI